MYVCVCVCVRARACMGDGGHGADSLWGAAQIPVAKLLSPRRSLLHPSNAVLSLFLSRLSLACRELAQNLLQGTGSEPTAGNSLRTYQSHSHPPNIHPPNSSRHSPTSKQMTKQKQMQGSVRQCELTEDAVGEHETLDQMLSARSHMSYDHLASPRYTLPPTVTRTTRPQ